MKKIASGPGPSTHYSDHYYDANDNTTLINTYTDGPTLISGFSIGVIVSYNSAGEPKELTQSMSNIQNVVFSDTSTFIYRADGLLASRSNNGGKITDYTYLRNGLESTVKP